MLPVGQSPNTLPSYTIDQGIKIKEVSADAFQILAALGMVLSIAATATFAGLGMVVPAAVGVGVITAIALGVIFAYVWSHEVKGDAANFIQSGVTSLLSSLALAIIFPMNLAKSNPKDKNDPRIDTNQTPILMIHGFLASSNNWLYHKSRLEANGHKNLFTVNLGSPLISIVEYAKKVEETVKEIQKVTGRDDLIIIAHSMGGLVARQYRYHHTEGVKVKAIITLGSPLNGTDSANLASMFSKAAEEMKYASEFVKGLQKKAKEDSLTQYLHVSTDVDHIICPQDSATMGGQEGAEQKTLEATGHVGYLFSDATATIILEKVKALKEVL